MKAKGKIALLGLGLAVGAVLLLTQAGNSQQQPKAFKLEGAWIAKVVGAPMQWAYNLTPDPSGRRASMGGSIHIPIKPQILVPPVFTDWEYNTDFIGELVMTGPNAGVFTAVWYGMKKGMPFDEVVLIGVNSGQVQFTEPGKSRVTHNLAMYAPSADGDGDGLPDPGQAPKVCLSVTTLDTRLPFLPPCTP